MKFLCKCLGGSHLYGLSGPQSDLDYRGVFVSQDVDYILGLKAGNREKAFLDSRLEGDDHFYFEVRGFLASLKSTNTQALEILYNEDWLSFTDEFKLIQDNKSSLLNSERFFISLTGGDKADRKQGYIWNEWRLASGERTGQLGGKRKEALDKYGYSPKNVVQMLRLIHCGITFFQEGYYPVYIHSEIYYPDVFNGWDLQAFLLNVKYNPQKYKLDQLKNKIDLMTEKLNVAYDNRKYNFVFDENKANEILREIYLEELNKW